MWYSYAIVRVVPRVERGEFLNVGVILYCQYPPFLETVYSLDEQKLLTLYPQADVVEIRAHLDAFVRIGKGTSKDSPIASLDNAARFRWLTAKRSTVVQTSAVHSGLCVDPAITIAHLQEQLVN